MDASQSSPSQVFANITRLQLEYSVQGRWCLSRKLKPSLSCFPPCKPRTLQILLSLCNCNSHRLAPKTFVILHLQACINLSNNLHKFKRTWNWHRNITHLGFRNSISELAIVSFYTHADKPVVSTKKVLGEEAQFSLLYYWHFNKHFPTYLTTCPVKKSESLQRNCRAVSWVFAYFLWCQGA